jgi:subtilisin family serine protease
MRRFFTTFIALLLLISPFLIASPASSQIIDPMQEIVIELEPDQNVDTFASYFLTTLDVPQDQQCQKQTLQDTCRIGHVYEHTIVGFSVFLTNWELQKADRLFGGDAVGIRSISTSSPVDLPLVSNSLQAAGETQIYSNAQVTPYNVQSVGGGTVDASNVRVAVIDTGVASNHPDLNVSQEYGIDCTWKERTDGLPTWYDGHGHGTHVSGTIGAFDNGIGVVGVAPGAEIVPVKVLTDQGMGTTASVMCGIDYVVGLGSEVQVANMSLGGGGWQTACGEDDPFHNAICVATERTIFVVAAGNSTANIVGYSPANYPDVVTVSAVTDYDGQPGGFGLMPALGCSAMSYDEHLATFSNFGAGIDAAAPGVCVLSTLPPSSVNGNLIANYGYASGTSMASPTAAGCFVAYIAENPDQVDRAVEQVLTFSKFGSPFINGDKDDFQEPWIQCGAPRYEGT